MEKKTRAVFELDKNNANDFQLLRIIACGLKHLKGQEGGLNSAQKRVESVIGDTSRARPESDQDVVTLLPEDANTALLAMETALNDTIGPDSAYGTPGAGAGYQAWDIDLVSAARAMIASETQPAATFN